MNINIKNISPLPDSVIEFLENLTLIEAVNRIIVFGSRAHDDYEKYSDLDLAIDAPKLSRLEWLKLREIAYYDIRTVLQISLVNFHTNPVRLKNQIIKTGEIIYVK